jgi:hypothetical protein
MDRKNINRGFKKLRVWPPARRSYAPEGSLKEYLNHLNIALGSCGEFHSCYESFKQAHQITDDEYEQLDQLHYKVENALLKLIESLQKKQKDQNWEDNFHTK